MVYLSGLNVNKHRLNTTISRKHWELLEKHANHFESQQKALEHAIELLENNQCKEISPKGKFWVHCAMEVGSICVISRDVLKALCENSEIESVFKKTHDNVIYGMENNLNKPLQKMNIKEIIDGLVFSSTASNWSDSASCTDNGEYYCLRLNHSLSLNGSKLNKLWLEELFKRYGARIESYISEHSVFFKIFKN
jgi:hypothetical protein